MKLRNAGQPFVFLFSSFGRTVVSGYELVNDGDDTLLCVFCFSASFSPFFNIPCNSTNQLTAFLFPPFP